MEPRSSESSLTLEGQDRHPEPGKKCPKTPPKPHFRIVASHSLVTQDVLSYSYRGSGTTEKPYIVDFIPDDPRNPMEFSMAKKWSLTLLVAVATMAVSFTSSAYSGVFRQMIKDFDTSTEIVTLGISLFVLGFAIGPLFWGPLSELYGRQILYFGTYAMLTAFNAGAAASQNIQTLIILRFLAGAFGSSPLTNAGGIIADMFPANQRGLAMAIFAAAPFLGPTASSLNCKLGPMVGGFLGETKGWRWVEGLEAIFAGALWLAGLFLLPETYAPVLLRKRADALSKMTGRVYLSKMEVGRGSRPSLSEAFKIALSRPWILLVKEPIVLLLSTYMAIIYGTLYMLFAAFPIVFQQGRGWSEGIGGLAFTGVMVGMLAAVACTIPDNKRYQRAEARSMERGEGGAPPEARLPPAMVGSVFLPLGLFWFSWTNSASIHWSVSIIGAAPFGFGMVLVFLSVMNYLIDSYTIYAASVLAASSVLRSLFGAVFPLFTAQMYASLGIHWASSVPAFLALVCVPFPFLFHRYGPAIRTRCRFASEAKEELENMRSRRTDDDSEKSRMVTERGRRR